MKSAKKVNLEFGLLFPFYELIVQIVGSSGYFEIGLCELIW